MIGILKLVDFGKSFFNIEDEKYCSLKLPVYCKLQDILTIVINTSYILLKNRQLDSEFIKFIFYIR